MRFFNSFTRLLSVVGLCSLSSSLPAVNAADSWVLTLKADPNQNGGMGLNALQCRNNQLFTTVNLIATVNINNIFPYQPMGENGLPVFNMAFTVGGQPGNVQVLGTFSAASSSANGNVWSFGLMDDGPNVGGQLIIGSCQGSTIPSISVAFSMATPTISTQGLPGGADGHPPTPALTNVKTTVVNMLPALFGGGSPTPTTKSPTAAPATLPPTPATPTSYVVTLGADPTQNGGQGINNIQCAGGRWMTTVNLLASININNIFPYQPMGELGLPLISMAFTLNGQPATVTVENNFNVASSAASGNVWTFGLMDDGPHPGGQLSLGTCTQNQAIPTITAQFSTASIVSAAGLPNGADGHPKVPAVNNVVPMIVNALPAKFVNGGAAQPTNAPTNAPTKTPTNTPTTTKTPTNAPTTAAAGGGAGGASITQVFTTKIGQTGYCTGGSLTVGVAITISQNGNAPMGENGLPTVTGAVTYMDVPVNIVSFQAYNMQPQLNANTFTFNELDDQPNVGGQLTVNVPCSYTGAGVPSATQVMITYTAAPVVLNGQQTNVIISGSGQVQQPAAMPTMPSAGTAMPTAMATPKTAAPTQPATVQPTTPPKGTTVINQQIKTTIGQSGYCTGGFLTTGINIVISQDGKQPMGENGLPIVTAAVTYNNQAVKIQSLNAFNMKPTLSGNTFTFGESDDMPNVGGQLTINVPCSFATPNGVPSTGGIAIAYSSNSALLNGGTTPSPATVIINNIPTAQLAVINPPNVPSTMITASSASSSSSINIVSTIIMAIASSVMARMLL